MRILFQGDSITDSGRDRENDGRLGVGYAQFVKANLGFREPGEHEYYNRGLSGNRVVDLYARIKKDIINLAPDFISILIGVNDVWHEINYKNGVDAEKYEKIYTMLIEEIKAALPNVKILIIEPFVLQGSATTGELSDGGDKYTLFRAETEKRAAAARRVAERFGIDFMPLQELFDKACELAPSTYWLRDGVHPTAAGHRLIANEWIAYFDKICKN